MKLNGYILRAAAPDAIGILAEVMSHLARHELNVSESHDFGDPQTKRFFIWAKFEAPEQFDLNAFTDSFDILARRLNIDWSMRCQTERPRALVMVSKGDHCLNDLLYRHRRGRLGADIVAIASNHMDAEWHAERHDIPFHHIPVSEATRAQSEDRLRSLIGEVQSDFVILARYMQILSRELTRELAGRCINIHHSALPSFKGARPYHQAHARGVKLVGATAHYVTAELDDGPIITQDVAPVDHRMSAERMAELGKDTEARVLARAVTAHAQGRVFLNDKRTVVF